MIIPNFLLSARDPTENYQLIGQGNWASLQKLCITDLTLLLAIECYIIRQDSNGVVEVVEVQAWGGSQTNTLTVVLSVNNHKTTRLTKQICDENLPGGRMEEEEEEVGVNTEVVLATTAVMKAIPREIVQLCLP